MTARSKPPADREPAPELSAAEAIEVDRFGLLDPDDEFVAPGDEDPPLEGALDLDNEFHPIPERPPFILETIESDGSPLGLPSLIATAGGAFSACWETLEGAGLFESSRALEIAVQLEAEITRRLSLAWQAGVIDQAAHCAGAPLAPNPFGE